MKEMMDWADIRYFLALAREGSALAAASQLNTNQTTVSTRIDRVENALGLKLFEKSTRGYKLTRNGEMLLPKAEQMENTAQAIEQGAVQSRRQLTGTIRFSGLVTTMRMYGLSVVDRFRELHPHVQFEVDTQERHVSLESGECDIAMRSTDRVVGDSLITRKIVDHPWAFYASEDYVQKHQKPNEFSDLQEHRLLTYSDSFCEMVNLLRDLRKRLPNDKISFKVDTPEGMQAVIKTGAGIGCLPRILGDEDSSLVRCFGEPELTHPIWLVASQEAYDAPLTRGFWDFFCASIPELRKLYSET